MIEHGRREIVLATCLSALSGFIDAVGFIAVGGFFVSFMSGNTTRTGVAIADGSGTDVGSALGLIAAFVIGVIAGSIVGHRGDRHRKPIVLAFVAAILFAAVELWALPGAAFVAPPLLAMAMGAENAVFERDGEVSIGLTYMTGTLVKMGQSIAHRILGTHSNNVWMRYFALWSSMAVGGILGALTYTSIGFTSVAVAAIVALVAAAVSGTLRL